MIRKLTLRVASYQTTKKREIVWGAGIFTVCLALRLIYLGSIPASLNPDEADTLQTFLFARYTGEPSLFGLNWNGAPALNTYLIGLGWEIFGKSIFGMRFASALITAVSCAVFFWFVHEITQERILALGVTLSLATHPWFLHFSRSAWENAWNALPVLGIAIGLFYLYEKQSVSRGFTLLILSSAAGIYLYHPGKLFAPAVLLVLLIGMPFSAYRIDPKWLLIFAILVGLLSAPQLLSLRGHEISSWDRIRRVSIFSREDPQKAFFENIARNAWGLLFFLPEDFHVGLNGRYIPSDKPPLTPLLTVLYVMGLVIALVRFPYLLLVYSLILLPVQIFSMGTPNAARGVHAVPMIFLFVTLGLRHGYEAAKTLEAPYPTLVQVATIVGALLVSFYQVTIYGQWIQNPVTLEAREPAVPHEEYVLWIQTLEERIQADKGFLNVGEWKRLRRVQRAGASLGEVDCEVLPGTDADRLKEPRDVAVAPDGTLYAVDTGNQQVFHLDGKGRYLGTLADNFQIPFAVTVDEEGQIYVLDTEGAPAIIKFSPEGEVLRRIESNAGLFGPRGLTVDDQGFLYVADTGGAQVVQLSHDGTILAEFTGGGQLRQPTDVDVSPDNFLYVTDPDASKVWKLSSADQVMALWEIPRANTYDAPHVTVDSAGKVYVTNPEEATISVFDPQGKLLLQAGERGESVGQFSKPLGFTIGEDGRLYVADTYNSRLQRCRIGEGQ